MWMLLKAIVWKWAKTSLRYEEIIGWNPLHQGFPNRGAGTPARAASLGDARTWIYIHIYLMCMHVCVIYVYSGHWLGCRRGVLGQKSLGTVLFYTCFCSFCCRKKKKTQNSWNRCYLHMRTTLWNSKMSLSINNAITYIKIPYALDTVQARDWYDTFSQSLYLSPLIGLHFWRHVLINLTSTTSLKKCFSPYTFMKVQVNHQKRV